MSGPDTFSTIGTGYGATTTNPNQTLNFYPGGSTTLSLQNGSTKKEGLTYATLGMGTINTNSNITFDANGDVVTVDNSNAVNINDDPTLAGLNRDITTTQKVTKDQITGALDVSATIDNRLFTTNGRTQIANEQEHIGENLKISTKAQAKLIDSPISLTATSNVPVLSYIASYLGGEGGSFATLATQLFGLNYLLDSGNTRWQENNIEGLDNKSLATAVKGKYDFALQRTLGEESGENQRSNIMYITDDEGNKTGYYYTTQFKDLNDVTTEDILNTRDYSLHGIDNTSDQGMRNAVMQLGTIQNQSSNELSFVTLNSPTKGGIPDAVENFYNMIFGYTPVASANITQLRDFSQDLGNVASQNNIASIRMVGHSNGGDRLYLGILQGASQNKAFENSGIQVQFYGTPAYTPWIRESARDAGLSNYQNIQNIVNSGDAVGNLLGRNYNDLTELENAVIKAPLLFITPLSPHSNYYCEGSFCNFPTNNK